MHIILEGPADSTKKGSDRYDGNRPLEGIEPWSPQYTPITDERRVYRYEAIQTSVVDSSVHCAVRSPESSHITSRSARMIGLNFLAEFFFGCNLKIPTQRT